MIGGYQCSLLNTRNENIAYFCNTRHFDSYADTAILHDFYIHVKTPPLSEMQLIINHDGDGSIEVNSGFVYVQNASPSGPIAWMLAEPLLRHVRFSLNDSVFQNLGKDGK